MAHEIRQAATIVALAEALGATPRAVRKARDSGRITLGPPPWEVEAVRRAWLANTSTQGPAPLATRGEADAPQVEGGDAITYSEARRLKEIARARLTELELAERAKELIPARELRTVTADTFAACRTQLLALTSRARQALPHLGVGDLEILDGLVREALQDLSTAGRHLTGLAP